MVLTEQELAWASLSGSVAEQFQGAELELDYLRAPDEGTREEAYGVAGDILGEYGLLQDRLDLRVSYLGFVPGIAGLPGVVAVVTATFPSGAVLTRAKAFLHDEAGISTYDAGVCTSTLSAAGTAAAQGVVAFRCDVQEPNGSSDDPAAIDSRPELVVLAPAELGGSYAVSGPITLELNEDGVGVVDFPEGAQSAVVQAADDTVIQELPIFTS